MDQTQTAVTVTVTTSNGTIDSGANDPCPNGNGNGPPSSNNNDNVRIGTISSARFNILSTMVGGGCLSLPMAFQKSGNALVGPLLLLLTGAISEFCFKTLVATAVHGKHKRPDRTTTATATTTTNTTTTTTKPGTDTFESITSGAFGPSARAGSAALVFFMCFFGAVGYAVLLRDMLAPLNHAIAPAPQYDSWWWCSEWLRHNFAMFAVILMVTPFCTLRRLTALKDCGLASMVSLLILGSCIVVRSVQCNCHGDSNGNSNNNSNNNDSGGDGDGDEPWYSHLQLWPESWRDVLDALPLYISCFVCHYNILPVHNELADPSKDRVDWWLRSTTWFAVGLYMVMGFAGSAYAPCTSTGKISGNILLDFDEHDPLLMVGRMCLAVTITLAFPMLVIPARAVVVRSLILPRLALAEATASTEVERSVDEELQEPLLDPNENDNNNNNNDNNNNDDDDDDTEELMSSVSSTVLISTSVVILWSMATLASVVSSIEVVWDLLGSSLSILLSYLIPAGAYLVITKQQPPQQQQQQPQQQQPEPTGREGAETTSDWGSRAACWVLIGVFVPLMVVSTINAVLNTFA
eukprot:jgi/Psemu1/192153/e_gw1.124.20.1